MEIFKRIIKIFNKIADVFLAIAAVLIVADAIAITFDVTLRKITGISIAGLFEFTVYSVVWICFLGVTWLLRTKGHVRMDLVLNSVKPRYQAILNIISSCIQILALGVMAWFSVKLTINDYQIGVFIPGVLNPPKWPIEIIIPIGTTMLFIQSCMDLYTYILDFKKLSRSKHDTTINEKNSRVYGET